MASEVSVLSEPTPIEWKKYLYLSIGIALFALAYLSPPWPDAIDPMGKHFALSREAKGAIAVLEPPKR